MKRVLAVGWAILVAGVAIAYSQGCFREPPSDPTPAPAHEPPSRSDSPVLMPASKADAGAGARLKRREGQVGRKGTPTDTDLPDAQQEP